MKKTILHSLFAALLCIGAVAPAVAMQSKDTPNELCSLLAGYPSRSLKEILDLLKGQPQLFTTPTTGVRTYDNGTTTRTEVVPLGETPYDMLMRFRKCGQHPELVEALQYPYILRTALLYGQIDLVVKLAQEEGVQQLDVKPFPREWLCITSKLIEHAGRDDDSELIYLVDDFLNGMQNGRVALFRGALYLNDRG